ncbi:UNVERIFIED_CONTAM: hypothetical protein HDU68_011635 [Siphonaria sp. JEL0065]|nr:hypothetical protein HDU68_011635 [Siphonaria sp. JEL0065]
MAKRRAAAIAARTAQAMALEAQQIDQEFTRRRRMSLEAAAAQQAASSTSPSSLHSLGYNNNGGGGGGGGSGFRISGGGVNAGLPPTAGGGIAGGTGGTSPRSVFLRKPMGSALIYAQSPASSLETIITRQQHQQQQQPLHGDLDGGMVDVPSSVEMPFSDGP